METNQRHRFKLDCRDFILNLGSLVLCVVDVVLDIYAVVDFYQEEDYVSLGVLVFLLLGSSVLSQAYSWLWYSYDEFKNSKVEGFFGGFCLKVVHLCQMGLYLRFAGVVEVSTQSFCNGNSEGREMSLSHDLNMLRLIETFSESSPQLVLMLTVIIHRGVLEPITVLKTAGSVAAIALSVTMYHRSLRAFLSDKTKQTWVASFVYFLWNLFLIGTRVIALALFTSVLPCYFPAHFLSLWIILVFCAWRENTTFMESPGGEQLFRATLGLIWYFSWFNVSAGRTKRKCLFYYSFITVDTCVLCCVWYWRITTDPPYFESSLPPYAVLIGMSVLYGLGLLFRVGYYKWFHPTGTNLRTAEPESEPNLRGVATQEGSDEVDNVLMDRNMQGPSRPARVKTRMEKLAVNFYSDRT
ncbi:XK-related protein 8-like [Osmerus eperlanus]|uniref:XK-related protein 8-like n=1 Tax=Osmerus eperlanus TaxID=29151 RepID=UPI002E0D20AC